MPVVDMPLDKMRVYQGSSPCPNDIDQFWDNSLDEMHNLNSKFEVIESTFQTPKVICSDLYYIGCGGARVHAKLLQPRDKKARNGAAVVFFHGYNGNCGDWVNSLAYVGEGFTTALLDCRGQGGGSGNAINTLGTTLQGHIVMGLADGPKNLVFRNTFLDGVQLIEYVMGLDDVDPAKVGVTGGSQGGGMSLACASLVPNVNRVSPKYPFLSDYKRVWDMDLDQNAYVGLRTFFRYHDPLHEREAEIFNTLGYIDIQNLTKRIRGKVMMSTGLIDTICPPSTQFAAFNKISSEKEVIIYSDFGHEPLPNAADRDLQFMLEML